MDLFQRLDEDITNIIIEHGFLNLDTLRFATEREVERAAVRALEMATPDQQLAIAMRQSVMGIEGDDAIIHENENEANDNDANDNAGNVVMEAQKPQTLKTTMTSTTTTERNASSASRHDNPSTASPAAAECAPAASGAVSARDYAQEAGRRGAVSPYNQKTSSRPPARDGRGW
ncbi:IBR domain-containing protein [Colletotrichum costaricense]|uniref:IBR domain-containing protein n=2 Tax=Colletotrichum acutatum species complex TaxID=2707335 RepID=A0AAI9Z053_9PEZI|nr:IBR domain-containing protein [Colletotrichum costaricense]XP_060387896.1 IBR domain-containing protein [Colletotrichum tamarilloi]KAK1510820.1 IBR domain-containing protein [Colletotrichum tamarilloi]KAK1528936.1 IBR domain-containing protein [Colletotrichum costaricense]